MCRVSDGGAVDLPSRWVEECMCLLLLRVMAPHQLVLYIHQGLLRHLSYTQYGTDRFMHVLETVCYDKCG